MTIGDTITSSGRTFELTNLSTGYDRAITSTDLDPLVVEVGNAVYLPALPANLLTEPMMLATYVRTA